MKADKQSGFGMVEVLLLVVIIALLGFIGWRIYEGSQQKTETQQPTGTIQNNEPQTHVIKFPELGVQMVVPERLKNITTHHKTIGVGPAVYLSTQEVTASDEGCSASGIAPPLGGFARVEGRYPESPNVDNSGGALVRQFDTFYIGWLGIQAACSEDTEVRQQATELYRLLSSSMKSMTEIEH